MSARRTIDPAVEEAGSKILKAFDVRERFFHIELFQTTKDNRIIALEVNMRPPGAWITDAMNYTLRHRRLCELGRHGGEGRRPAGRTRANISPPTPAARIIFAYSHMTTQDRASRPRRQDRPPSGQSKRFSARPWETTPTRCAPRTRGAARGGRLHPRGKGLKRCDVSYHKGLAATSAATWNTSATAMPAGQW